MTPVNLRMSGFLAAWCVIRLSLCATTPGSAADTEALERLLDAVHQRYAGLSDGIVAEYIPALAKVDPDLFGLVIVTVDGDVLARGDTEKAFAIMWAAKPFTLALLMQQQGTDVVLDRIGVEPTGQPYNSLAGIDRGVLTEAVEVR